MIFEEMLREEKLEGRLEATKENILELLEDLGEIPDGLRDKIAGLEELEDLKVLHKIAASAHSLYAFEEEAEKYLQSKKKNKIGGGSIPPEHICLNAVGSIGVYEDS